LFVVLAVTFASAQNNSQTSIPKKEHYRVLSYGNDNPMLLEKAMYHANLDSLRFINERRKLKVEGTNLVLELFSANELLETYKRPIHPLNIANAATARKYILRIDSGVLTVVPQK